MVRILGFLIGLGFVLAAAWAFGKGAWAYIKAPPEATAEQRLHEEPRRVSFSFDGPFGNWDRRQLQRGFQVYKEVCAACHGLTFVAFRNLRDLGYSEAEVRAIADQWPIQVASINPDTGEAATRKPIPADHFPNPYPNETAARAANNNALPPDLSLMAKAREGGPAYIYSLLTGFHRPPAGYQVPPNLHYNPYFANLNIAMPPPITADGQVSYAPGNPPATRDQMAQDVSAFLMWAAEPNLVTRKNAGMVTLLFLLLATILGYMAYQQIWHGPKRRGTGAAG
ncbi:MAG TPA: cytochrome c1 [Allosphingosinicella sp.]|nr:cytochrome c1 [Allosphingosinicella sp.]